MQLHESHVVNELTNYREVNMALQDGWKLLAVMSASSVSDPARIQVHYVAGKPKDNAAPESGGFTVA